MAVQDTEAGEQARPNNSYYLAKCVLRSSVVLHAVYGHIRSPATFDLVFGKESALELVVLSEDGTVQSVWEQPVFGTIKALKVLPWNEHYRGSQPQTHGKDLLVLLSDSGKLSFLTFCIELHRFLAVAHVHLSQPGNMREELGQLLAIESRGRAVAVGAFEDKIAVFPTSAAVGNNIVEKRMIYPRESAMSIVGAEASFSRPEITTGTIWSLTFVTTSMESKVPSSKAAANLVLAVLLHRKGASGNELQVLVCDTKERCIHLMARYNPSVSPIADSLAYDVIDVPSFPGFILLFRPGDIVLLDVRNPSNPCTISILPLVSNGSHEKFKEHGGVCEDDEEGKHNVAGVREGDEEGKRNVAASALLELLTRTGEGIDGTDETSKKEGALPNLGKNGEYERAFLTMTCAWSWEPDSSHQPRIMLGLDSGEILMVEFSCRDPIEVKIASSECLYKCSPCKSLVWTKGGFVAALVEMGDGQVLQIKGGKVIRRNLIQNIAPILDFALVDYHNEKQDQMFACTGVGEEGSLRVIRNGVSVEKLISTLPLYQGVTGTWAMHIHRGDAHHAFLVISFVEETRVLSVGLNFVDITDSVGFEPSVCTLACGLIENGWVAQVCSNHVRICAPTIAAHPGGLVSPFPPTSFWRPEGLSVSLGAVAHRKVILAMSHPGLLLMLGLRTTPSGEEELFELQQCQFHAELSCISIPQEEEPIPIPVPPAIVGLVEVSSKTTLPSGVEIGKVCVVGTHQPSVELLSIVPGENFSALAVGPISLVNTMGTAVSGCIPEDVRLVLFDHPYILSGLRNGMLLRFEWPAIASMSARLLSTNMSTGNSPLQDHMTIVAAAETSPQVSPDVESCPWQTSMYLDSRCGCGEVVQEGSEASSPVQLHLIAVRRVGVSPVSLIPLQTSLRADIVALSDRPWLLQTARHSQKIAYTSISFQPSTHATPVKSSECSKGILFVADCSLHLVEMEHSKRLNVQRLLLRSTPRRTVYHSDSKTLLVMRTEYCEEVSGSLSDICCVDPLSGALISSFEFEPMETPKCMKLWKVGNEQLLLVGTGLTTGRAMMPSGEPESAKGRLLIFQLEPQNTSANSLAVSSGSTSAVPSLSQFSDSSSHVSEQLLENDICMNTEDLSSDDLRLAEGEGWVLRLKSQVRLPGVVLAVSPYLEQYILASAGNSLSCLGFPSDSQQCLKRLDTVKTRFMITCIAVHLNRIAVGDCRDGILFYSYQEDLRKLEQLYCDPMQRLVADCVLMDLDTAMVTDRRGNFCGLSCANLSEESSSPERNLMLSCWYHLGEIIMSIHKGSFAYKLPTENISKSVTRSSQALDFADSSVVASTLLGSVVIFIQVSREEYELLDAVQRRLSLYPITAPLLGNDHSYFRGQGCPAGVCMVLDGDMLGQFLELTSTQQQAVLADRQGLNLESLSSFGSSLCTPTLQGSLPVEKVFRLLERVHNSLT